MPPVLLLGGRASSSSAAAAPTGPQESGSEEDQSSEDSEGEWSAPDFASDVSSSEWTGGSGSESDSWSDSGGGAGVDSNDDDGHEFDGYRLVDMDNLWASSSWPPGRGSAPRAASITRPRCASSRAPEEVTWPPASVGLTRSRRCQR